MADWEEIKRLAADFQRAQLSDTVQRLSERNCIEIVQRLVELKLIDVIYTTDGKEYLTPQELAKEIREELIVQGGRINLVDLRQALNVDFSHVETKVNEIVSTDKSLTLVLGQLIDRTYVESLAEEINDKLQEQGQVTLAELTKAYDLPAEFLFESIQQHLGSTIQGRIDEYARDIIFTEAFVNRYKAKILGAFSAVTRPTVLGDMMNRFGLQERLFYNILEDLVNTRQLAGSISGGRKDKAIYIPAIYTRSQNQWVDDFYKQNGYLEYDALTRLGISDPKGFIRKRLKGESLTYLSTCCVGSAVGERVKAEVEEVLDSHSWVDVMPSLPSILSFSDASQLIQECIKSHAEALLFCDTIVSSNRFISTCSEPFDKLVLSRAEEDVKNGYTGSVGAGSGKFSLDDGREDKKEQRRKKAAGGKAGGGTQGRESKTKSTKKKGHRNRDVEEDEEEDARGGGGGKGTESFKEFMSLDDMEAVLRENKSLEECPDEFITEIAAKLARPFQLKYQEAVKSVFLQNMGSDSTTSRRKTHGELQEKINGLWTNARLFEKGLKHFPEETQQQLSKHLLKTICSDIAGHVFNAVAAEQLMSLNDSSEITQEMRVKLLSKMPEDETKKILSKIHTSLNNKTPEDFFNHLDKICQTGHLEIVLKKADKNKERQLIFSHRQALAKELRGELAPAMGLHLASVLLFMVHTQSMIHASGRFVPQIIAFLEPFMSKEQHQVLLQCQDLVMQQLRKESEGEDPGDISSQLNELLPVVKDIALNARRGQIQQQEQA